MVFLELMVGGFGWVNNLVATDPYLILPIAIGIVNFLNIEVSYDFSIHYH